MEKVYIVILNYNTWEDTIECLQSVVQLNYDDYHVVLVDNASKDNSTRKFTEWIQKNKLDNEITLIVSKKNRGYSGGNNLGINYAIKEGDADYIWILNSDTVVDENSLIEMVRKAKDTKAGGIGSVILYYKNRNKIQLIGNSINYNDFSLHNMQADVELNELKPNLKIDTLPGPSFLLSRSFIQSIGTLDETYFLYCEELELAARAKRKNWKLVYAEKSYVYHKGNLSAGQKSTAYRDYHVIRSWEIFIGRWHKELLSTFVNRQKKILWKRLKHLHFKRAWAIYQGLKSGRLVLENES